MEDKKTDLELGYVKQDELQIGEVYPLFGVITEIKQEGEKVIVQINNDTKIEMKEGFGEGKTLIQDGLKEPGMEDKPKIDLMQEYLMEKGIFISELIEKEPQLRFVCHTVILGKKQLTTNH